MKNHHILVALFLPSLVCGQSLVLIGGGVDDPAVFRKIVELAGGPGVAKIGVFGIAAFDPETAAAYYTDLLLNTYGVLSAEYIPVTETSGNANDQAIVDLILQQTGFFFEGGDQQRVVAGLKNPDYTDTLSLTAVKTVFQNGGVVSGTSAGASCMGNTVMITGGVSFDALVNGASPGGPDPTNPDNLSYDEHFGIGFLSGYVIDTHFSERGREGRMIRLLQDTKLGQGGVTRGFGLDEDMALAIYNVGTSEEVGEVVGPVTGGVVFFDVSQVVETPSSSIDYRNISSAFLTLGDKINMMTGEVTFATWKNPLIGQEANSNAVPSTDIFSVKGNGEWRNVAKSLFNSQLDTTVVSSTNKKRPVEFEVVMDRTYGYAYAGTASDGSFVVSHADLRVDIHKTPAV